MSDSIPSESTMPTAGPSTSSRRKRSSEELTTDAQTQAQTEIDEDGAPARKRIATGEPVEMTTLPQNKDGDRDSGKAVDLSHEDGNAAEQTTGQPKTEDQTPEKKPLTYWPLLQESLELAVRRGANKWTARDLMKSYPHLSAGKEKKESFEELWKRAADEMRDKMMNQASGIMQHYEIEPALDRLETAVVEARTRKTNILRGEQGVYVSDVWRPDLSPQALTAAYNLPRYDAVYTRLREEYIQLYKDCETLAGEVDSKKRRMDEMREQVVQANEQLKETAEKLEGVPNEGIKMWMGDAASNDKDSRTIA